MKQAFFEALCRKAAHDEDLVLLVGDVGMGFLDPLKQVLGPRFINAGVSEQNAIAMAAGLSREGYRVFWYSIGNFATLRCLEHWRNLVIYPEENVVVVAVGGGLGYGAQGFTHHAVEDLAVSRSFPQLTTWVPNTSAEAAVITESLCDSGGPSYLRLERGEVEDKASGPFVLGQPRCLRPGKGKAIIAIGASCELALEVGELLSDGGEGPGVFSLHRFSRGEPSLLEILKDFEEVVTIEEHSEVGGLGSYLAELSASSLDTPIRVKRIALDPQIQTLGSSAYLRKLHGLDAAAIVQRLREERR